MKLLNSSTSRYLDDLLNNDNSYSDGLISQIYPSELQINKANSSETKLRFWICICHFKWVYFIQNL